MTYKELTTMCQGKTFPLCAKNEDGENVVIAHGCNETNYFKLTTAQHNGWTRQNIIFEDGSTEEFYERR